MVNTAHRNSSASSDRSTSQSGSTEINPSPDTPLSQRPKYTNFSQIDDVIGSLANAYENKRARQVVEWERLWRQKFYDSSQRAVM